MSRREDRLLAAIIIAAWLAIMAMAVNLWLKPWPDVLLRADFVSYWTAASMVRNGDAPSMFDIDAERSFQSNLRTQIGAQPETNSPSDLSPYYNPPVMAWLFLPLTVLPMPLAYVTWNIVSLAMMAAAVALPLRGHPWGASLAALLVSFGGVAATLFEGQANAVFVLALSLALVLLTSGRPFSAGALLGLIWLKPQYAIVFALVFVIKRRWRELAGMVTVGLALAVASAATVGASGVWAYLSVMSRIGGYYPPTGFRINPQAMANWRGLLMHLFPGIAETSGNVLVLVLGAVTVLLSLSVWRGTWSPSSPRFGQQMLVAALATVIASPHSHFHGTVLLLPPLAMVLAEHRGWLTVSRTWKAVVGVGYLLALIVFPLRDLSWLFVPYFLAVIVYMALASLHDRTVPRPDLVRSEALL